MTVQPAHYSQCGCHTAQGDRQVLSSLVCTEGVVLDVGNGLAVTPTSPASLAIQVDSGNAFIQGDNVAWQGMYHVSNDSSVTVPVTAADPAQDRIDIVVAQVRDSTYSGPNCDWQIAIIEGTPSSPPAPPTVPVNSIPLARYTLTAGAGSVTAVTDLRTSYAICPGGQSQPSLPSKLVFTSGGAVVDFAGTYAWVKRAVAIACGGGGGGGGASPTAIGEASWGTGGGSGAYARAEIIPELLSSGQLTIAVGAAGAGGVGSATGATGGVTTFTDGTTSLILAGGAGGNSLGAVSGARFYTTGGNGGSVSGAGAAGAVGWVGELDARSGHDGYSGQNDGAGIGGGGNGADSVLGQRGGGKSYAAGTGNGGAASGNGAGGGGAYNGGAAAHGSNVTGGAGSPGIVTLYLYDH